MSVLYSSSTRQMDAEVISPQASSQEHHHYRGGVHKIRGTGRGFSEIMLWVGEFGILSPLPPTEDKKLLKYDK